MAKFLYIQVQAPFRWWHRRATRSESPDAQAAERAHRLEVALAERDAARLAFRRRWGAYICHIPNDPYDDWLAPGRKRP